MRYRLIIFDFDGTLADSFWWFLGAMDGIAERFGGRPIDRNDLPRLRQLGPKQLLDHLALPFWKVPMVVGYGRQLMAQSIQNIELFPGMCEVLRQLSARGTVISIVSSNSEENVRAVLGTECAEWISAYECGTSIFGKAARFRRVLKRTGFLASETICIGDEIRDIDAARKVGIACGAVAWGYADVEALRTRAPQVIFTQPGEILEL